MVKDLEVNRLCDPEPRGRRCSADIDGGGVAYTTIPPICPLCYLGASSPCSAAS